MLRVIFIAPNCEPRELFIGPGYEQLQALVGGTIAASRLAPGLSLTYNDNGLYEGLPPNLRTDTDALFVGNLVVCRIDDEGEDVDIADSDLKHVQRMIKIHCSRVASFQYDEPTIMVFGFDEQPRKLPRMTVKAIHLEGEIVTA